MKFFDFCDSQYQQRNLKLQMSYDHKIKAESEMTMMLIDWQKSYFKFLAFFKLTSYFLTCLITQKWPKQYTAQEFLQAVKDQKENKLKSVEHSKETECQNENQIVS